MQLFIGVAFLAFLGVTPLVSHAQSANECSFSRTLEDGVDGEDVRCLQKYLNGRGFVIAESGPGSVGNETSLFRTLTKEAVVKWQKANNVNPASGVFGPQSQAAYLLDLIAKIEAKKADDNTVAKTDTSVVAPTPKVAGVSSSIENEDKKEVESLLKEVLKMIRDAEEEVEDVDDEDDQSDMEDDLVDARADLYDALESYFDEDYEDSIERAEEALDVATEVFEDAGGETDSSKAKDVLDDVEDLYDEVSDLLADAEDDDADVGDAEDFLEEAEDLIASANKSYKNKIYRQAISDALDAEELLEEARDEIDYKSNDEVEEFIADMWNEYNDAKEEMEAKDEKGKDIGDAEDLLKSAKKKLNKAEDAFDDKEYEDALDYAEEAEELIEDALDEL